MKAFFWPLAALWIGVTAADIPIPSHLRRSVADQEALDEDLIVVRNQTEAWFVLVGDTCGGTLISKNRVVTRAYCVSAEAGGVPETVQVGRRNVTVYCALNYPDYAVLSNASHHDVAILKLAENVNDVEPADLNTTVIYPDQANIALYHEWLEDEMDSNTCSDFPSTNVSQRDVIFPDNPNPIPNPSGKFYTAEDLLFMRYGIPQQDFEWINPNEIVASGTTCGWLKAPLGSLPGVDYPRIKVYVCMRFADIQPAKKGNLFVHCGGPGSLSDCIGITPLFTTTILADYNLLSIDQRGMGRSWPSFAHEECSLFSYTRDAVSGNIKRSSPPPEYLAVNSFTNATDVKLALQPSKRRVFKCWNCKTCDFQLTGADNTTYHFLEYSGTSQLAEDIERMRKLLNAPYMHVYGVSYGTEVMGTYATIFKQSVGLFVIDSCSQSFPDSEAYSRTKGRTFDTRTKYAVYSCTAKNAATPGSCAVAEDLPRCIASALKIFKEDSGYGYIGTDSKNDIGILLDILFAYPEKAGEVCAYANTNDAAKLKAIIATLKANLEIEIDGDQLSGDPASMPTSETSVYGNPDYSWLTRYDEPQALVKGQDYFSANFDEEYFANEVVDFTNKYTAFGTGEPGDNFFFKWSQSFYWPKATPMPPIGNPLIEGIVAGFLFDSNTHYSWTQEMRQRFPSTHLLTSQGVGHGLLFDDPSCQPFINNYFEIGEVLFNDGHTCGSPFASLELIEDAFNKVLHRE